MRIAYFITPHGFGHAARAAAVMKAIHQFHPSVHFDIYTLVPPWFFEESIPGIFTYHETLTDIGLVQDTPLEVDIPATILALQDFFPFNEQNLIGLEKELCQSNCQLVICDISPLGIAVGEKAKIPSILIENFTWDWIYEPYIKDHPQFIDIIRTIKYYIDTANYHIQTLPTCRPDKNRSLSTSPISRPPNQDRRAIRQQLGISEAEKMILVSMGGIRQKFQFLEKLKSIPEYRFILPGSAETSQRQNNLILLPFHSSYYHPNLLHASDAVIGKVGYSTLSETYHAGIPFGYVARSNFRESRALIDFIGSNLNGIKITEDTFHLGSWVEIIPDLVGLPKIKRDGVNGATQAATFILELLAAKE